MLKSNITKTKGIFFLKNYQFACNEASYDFSCVYIFIAFNFDILVSHMKQLLESLSGMLLTPEQHSNVFGAYHSS